ncbi:MAG: hypothetical protein AAGJ40_16450 [Planctomycetota bacterium]
MKLLLSSDCEVVLSGAKALERNGESLGSFTEDPFQNQLSVNIDFSRFCFGETGEPIQIEGFDPGSE